MSAGSGFDVRAYMRAPHVLRPSHLDPQAVPTPTPATLATLAHLWCAERGLLGRLRDVLLTPTHAESRVTAFLTTWSYEQYWLAETLRAVLAAHGPAPQEPADTAPGGLLRAWDERLRPTVDAVGTNLLGADVTGAHMVTSWLDTAVLALHYRRLGSAEPALGELTGAVAALKERHLAFYAEEAATRLAARAGARRIARVATARWSWPGTRYAGPAPARAGAGLLLADPACRARVAEIDTGAAAFPGLAGIRPVRTALGRLAPRSAEGPAHAVRGALVLP
jgi:hypothetical protein